MADVSLSDAESLTVTVAFVPLKTSALPYLPAVVHAAFAIVPWLPFPDRSTTVARYPSSKE